MLEAAPEAAEKTFRSDQPHYAAFFKLKLKTSLRALQFILGFILVLHYASFKLSSTQPLNSSKQTVLGKIETRLELSPK